jgi:hypothetical protein
MHFPRSLAGVSSSKLNTKAVLETYEAMIGWSRLTAAQREQLAQQDETMSQSIIALKEVVFWMADAGVLTNTNCLGRSGWV